MKPNFPPRPLPIIIPMKNNPHKSPPDAGLGLSAAALEVSSAAAYIKTLEYVNAIRAITKRPLMADLEYRAAEAECLRAGRDAVMATHRRVLDLTMGSLFGRIRPLSDGLNTRWSFAWPWEIISFAWWVRQRWSKHGKRWEDGAAVHHYGCRFCGVRKDTWLVSSK